MTPRLLPIARVAAWAIGLGGFALAVDAAGCIDPQADYDEFVARPVTQHEASVVDVPLTACDKLLNQNPSGRYIMWCRPVQVPIPFAVAVEQTIVSGDGAEPTLQFTIASLRSGATKASDTVGKTTTLAPTKLNVVASSDATSDDCAYHYDIGTLTLAAEANSLGRDLEAKQVLLRGKLQDANRSCAELDGRVDDPISIDLTPDGDICILQRVPADDSVPMVADGDYACDPKSLPPR